MDTLCVYDFGLDCTREGAHRRGRFSSFFRSTPPKTEHRQPMESESETPIYDESPGFRRRLVDYAGTGFLYGGGVGSAFHFVRGLRSSSPTTSGGVRAVLANGPRVAARWGAYAAVFCAFERAMFLARRREEEYDTWNSVAAGAATAGLFGARRGAASAARSGLLGAAVVAGFAGAFWATEFLHSHVVSCRVNRDVVSPAPVVRTGSGPRPTVDG